VLAAVEGETALDSLLAGGTAPAATVPANARTKAPATATLRAVTVEGFRGIGRAARLEFPPGPGLTLVVGRNGSGKSSFAEALELLLTGDTFRWSGKRSRIWREGWRNLHHETAVIQAELILEGEKTLTTVARRWADDAPLENAETTAQVHGRTKTGLDGWPRRARSATRRTSPPTSCAPR